MEFLLSGGADQPNNNSAKDEGFLKNMKKKISVAVDIITADATELLSSDSDKLKNLSSNIRLFKSIEGGKSAKGMAILSGILALLWYSISDKRISFQDLQNKIQSTPAGRELVDFYLKSLTDSEFVSLTLFFSKFRDNFTSIPDAIEYWTKTLTADAVSRAALQDVLSQSYKSYLQKRQLTATASSNNVSVKQEALQSEQGFFAILEDFLFPASPVSEEAKKDVQNNQDVYRKLSSTASSTTISEVSEETENLEGEIDPVLLEDIPVEYLQHYSKQTPTNKGVPNKMRSSALKNASSGGSSENQGSSTAQNNRSSNKAPVKRSQIDFSNL